MELDEILRNIPQGQFRIARYDNLWGGFSPEGDFFTVGAARTVISSKPTNECGKLRYFYYIHDDKGKVVLDGERK